MCGIVGYVGHRDAVEFLLKGLRRLEYRGYDSAGVAMIDSGGQLVVAKQAGRIQRLESLLAQEPIAGTTGIAHTRWATHGAATSVNAHPHIGGDGVLALVHNGVIDNCEAIRQRLASEGYGFRSQTDTEVIAHLIAACLAERRVEGDLAAQDYRPLVSAVQAALAQLQGTYGLAVIFRQWPEVMLAARLGSPLIVGVGSGEHFVASDASPLVGHTDRIVYLADHELALITADSLRVVHRDQGRVQPSVHVLEVDAGDVGLGGYAHYMLKEIFEQPESVRNAMRG
ncbi:MAG TPA: glutamine--fructose-6-phosphate aminotransferase, partial [Planctomycetaceae bacterium]|nr:glutamine--fructose-6-phosphate aminotransferase [Planctomycetaceae bacterium]